MALAWYTESEGLFIFGRLLTLGCRAKKVGAGVDGRCSSVGKQGCVWEEDQGVRLVKINGRWKRWQRGGCEATVREAFVLDQWREEERRNGICRRCRLFPKTQSKTSAREGIAESRSGLDVLQRGGTVKRRSKSLFDEVVVETK